VDGFYAARDCKSPPLLWSSIAPPITDHQIKIGKFSDPVPGELYPKLTDVAGTCPPEDVGGAPGYEEFLKAMADPKHPEHNELKEWYGHSFDPNIPQTDELKLDVLKLAKKWKPRKTKT